MSEQAPAQGANAGQATEAPGGGQAGGQMDAIDKGVNTIADKTGHHLDRSKVEKVSDGLRKVFKKATGKEPPVADKG